MRVMLFKDTNLYKKVYNDGLLLPDYSFRNFYNYKFQNTEILPYVDFINNDIISTLKQKIHTPYFALRKYYEMARAVGDVSNSKEILEIENIQRKLLYKYYDIIFIENNLIKAKQKKEEFIFSLEQLSFDFKQRTEEYKKIYREYSVMKR